MWTITYLCQIHVLLAHQFQRVADRRMFRQSLLNTLPSLAAGCQQIHVANHVEAIPRPRQSHADPIAERQEADRSGLVATDQRQQNDLGFLALVVVYHGDADSVKLFVAFAFL